MSEESFELILVPEEDKQQRVEQDLCENKYSTSEEFELLFVPIQVTKERVERERQVLQELRNKRQALSSSSEKEQEQKDRSFLWEWKELFHAVKSRMHRPPKRY